MNPRILRDCFMHFLTSLSTKQLRNSMRILVALTKFPFPSSMSFLNEEAFCYISATFRQKCTRQKLFCMNLTKSIRVTSMFRFFIHLSPWKYLLQARILESKFKMISFISNAVLEAENTENLT